MRARLLLSVLGVSLLGAPLLASCSSSKPSSQPTPTPTTAVTSVAGTETASPSAGESVSATPSVSPTPTPSGPPRCHTSQLAVAAGGGQGAAGTIFLAVTLTNTSAQTCHLFGYPGMALLDANKKPLATQHVIRGGGMLPARSPAQVVLKPGALASFTVSFSDVPSGTGDQSAQCPQSSSELVTPPDETDPLTLTTPLAPCNGEVHVSPVVAGSAGVSP